MNAEEITVVVPRKENVVGEEEQSVAVWPLVEAALERLEADDSTREAARAAIETSDGCVVLANFLDSAAQDAEAGAGRPDARYRVPLLVLAAEKAREDDGADSVYDAEAGMLYFETDDDSFAFDVDKDWTVNWPAVADEEIAGYEWTGIENRTWALDKLMDYLDSSIDIDDYLVDDDEDEA